MVAWEGCREHLGQNPCDKRLSRTQTSPHFPAVDFSLVSVEQWVGLLAKHACLYLPWCVFLQIEDDEDVLWQLEHRESKAEIMERGLRFSQVPPHLLGGGAPLCLTPMPQLFSLTACLSVLRPP